MNKLTYTLLITVIVLGALVLRAPLTRAAGPNFAGVVPFINATGYLGFFNQNTGTIYMYNSDLTKCVYQGSIDELGKPFTKIDATDAAVPTANGH